MTQDRENGGNLTEGAPFESQRTNFIRFVLCGMNLRNFRFWNDGIEISSKAVFPFLERRNQSELNEISSEMYLLDRKGLNRSERWETFSKTHLLERVLV